MAVVHVKSTPATEGLGADSTLLCNLINALVEAGLSSTHRTHRVQVLAALQMSARQGAHSQIDLILGQAPVDQLAETSLMTLLRGCFSFRSCLQEWIGFRDRVAEELKNRGADVGRLMIGLY